MGAAISAMEPSVSWLSRYGWAGLVATDGPAWSLSLLLPPLAGIILAPARD